jgi:hypothetical protein
MIGRTVFLAVPLILLTSCSGEKAKLPVLQVPAEEERPAHRAATVPSAPVEGQSVKILPPDAAGDTRSNAPPEIRSVKFVPEVFRPGDSLGVEVSGSDPDSDEVTFEYAWEKNGLPAGKGSRVEGALRRNDEIAVTITPFDGKVRGRPLTLRRKVRNVPPSIEGAREARMVGDVYSCRILAKDGDGDPLTYVLKKAPKGMSIQGSTGTIRWEVPAEVEGKVPVTVSVADGNGGEATYAMVVTIQKETAPQEPLQDRKYREDRGGASSGQQR